MCCNQGSAAQTSSEFIHYPLRGLPPVRQSYGKPNKSRTGPDSSQVLSPRHCSQWKIQNAIIVVESSQCGDQLAHVLGFVSKVRLTLFLCRIHELIHSKRVRWTLLVLTHDAQHVLVLQNFGRLSSSRPLLPQLRLPSLLLDLPSSRHLDVDEIN